MVTTDEKERTWDVKKEAYISCWAKSNAAQFEFVPTATLMFLQPKFVLQTNFIKRGNQLCVNAHEETYRSMSFFIYQNTSFFQ